MPALPSRLRCSYCQTGFAFKGSAGFGTLTCRCDRWPVVDGIPVLQRTPLGVHEHTTGDAETARTDYRQLVELIDAGRHEEALIRCLAFPVEMPGLARLIGWRLSNSNAFTRLRYALCVPQVRRLLERRDSLSAVDLFHFFCRPDSPLGEGPRDYFIHRFGQPRHIAALALLENLPSSAEDRRPVLDVACGAGHFDHYLTQRPERSSVIGTDINFFQLWIAKHWIAPAAEFVCADLRDGLPFADDTFSAVFCSDAYHYVPNRGVLIREMKRCAPGRPAILTRVGNAQIGPNEGRENTLAGYLQEIEEDVKVFHEHQLVRDYLGRRNPLASTPDTGARECKWLSFAWNVGAREPAGWPHAIGKPVLNPIYQRSRSPEGWSLKHAFPSAWFAFENGAMLTYQPRRATVEAQQLRLKSNVGALAERFLIIGVPERYCPADARERRPWHERLLRNYRAGRLRDKRFYQRRGWQSFGM